MNNSNYVPTGLNKIYSVSRMAVFNCYKEEIKKCYTIEETNGVVQMIPVNPITHVKKIIGNVVSDKLFEQGVFVAEHIDHKKRRITIV